VRLIIIACLTLFPFAVSAESVLEELPFGIVIGVTTNEEIENRGVCRKEIKVSESSFRCETYSMQEFEVTSSQNEIVSAIIFREGSGHRLPGKWRQLGLSIANTVAESNSSPSHQTVVDIFQQEGAVKLSFQENTPVSLARCWTTITFELGSFLYAAEFCLNETSPIARLGGIVVTEDR
jgi:hypothetical protein